MATYLQLVKDAARESGTVPAFDSIANVTGQTGRVNLFCGWVRQAYEEIQLEREEWRWMQAEFAGGLIASSQSYAASDLGIAAERFAHWILPDDGNEHLTIYKTSEGRDNEGYLIERDWDSFRRTFMMGPQATDSGPPTHFSVDPRNNLVFYKIPDAAYTVSGRYYKAPQILAANADVPEMPARFHPMIKWKALVLMCNYDEAYNQVQVFQAFYDQLKNALEGEQLPRMMLAGPLA